VNYHFTSELANPIQAKDGQRFFTAVFEHGFWWWWYDPVRKGWYVGTAPQIQKPSWAA
jgi:hypothetical protein